MIPRGKEREEVGVDAGRQRRIDMEYGRRRKAVVHGQVGLVVWLWYLGVRLGLGTLIKRDGHH